MLPPTAQDFQKLFLSLLHSPNTLSGSCLHPHSLLYLSTRIFPLSFFSSLYQVLSLSLSLSRFFLSHSLRIFHFPLSVSFTLSHHTYYLSLSLRFFPSFSVSFTLPPSHLFYSPSSLLLSLSLQYHLPVSSLLSYLFTRLLTPSLTPGCFPLSLSFARLFHSFSISLFPLSLSFLRLFLSPF